MALIITPEIQGQNISSSTSYCYLFEPLRIKVTEDNLAAKTIFVDMEIVDTSNSSNVIVVEELYGVFDINPSNGVSIDLMKLARQYHDSQVYKYSTVDEIVDPTIGWHSIVSKYKYNFRLYSDATHQPYRVISKLPIIGGRDFKDFTPNVDTSQPLTEAALQNVELGSRWIGYPIIVQSLVDPTASNSSPSLVSQIQSVGCAPESYIIYKSRLGGWMVWGFDISIEVNSGMYSGNLDVGMFESTTGSNGQAYIPVDYTEIRSSYSYQMKALSLINSELRAVVGIHNTPAVYFYNIELGRLELMRKASSTTPISSIANGGDFALSLKSISNSSQKTR